MIAPHRDPDVLRRHVRSVLRFYYPECVDRRFGGYVLQFDERDGHCYDGRSKHLVGTARAVHNFSVGALLDGPDWCAPTAAHGLEFLDTAHWDEEHGGYHWLLSGREPEDCPKHCYGHAFVLLAAARALQADVPGARETLERAERVLESQFRDDHSLYADRAASDWSSVASYRGQNANMHACEAYLVAYEATGTDRYLDRAYGVAEELLTLRDDPRIWEHYDEDWTPDYDYNRDRPRDTFRPWGYQPGHHVEWAKLLRSLARHRTAPWLRDRAVELFDFAVQHGWDDDRGGFYYTLNREGDPMVAEKYGWPVAEAIGASALLARDDDAYWDWYDRFWAYAHDHLVNRKFGNWYTYLSPSNERPEPGHGPAVEPGYHPISNALVARQAVEDDFGFHGT